MYADSPLSYIWWTGWKIELYELVDLTTFVFLRAAQECGEYSATSAWTSEIFTAPNMMFGQEVRNFDPLQVKYIFPGEASRPCGDGPHQGQAPIQGASSNNRFCKGLLFCQCNFYFNNVLRSASLLWAWWTPIATRT